MGENSKWYKLIYKQIQPIHIGIGSYGVINETRIFIPGWTMWGALTKAYNLNNGKELSENHDIFENISCFYPCFDENGNDILFPEIKEGKLYLGNYSEDEFRAKFVDTFVSTSIDIFTNTALQESLHEINVILPGAKNDFLEIEKEKQIYWVGVIKLDKKFVPNIPKTIYIGGDVRYGFGKMEFIEKKELSNNEKKNWKFEKNYYPYSSDKNLTINGKLEFLIDIVKPWNYKQLQVEYKGFYYIPGSKIKISNTPKIKKGIII